MTKGTISHLLATSLFFNLFIVNIITCFSHYQVPVKVFEHEKSVSADQFYWFSFSRSLTSLFHMYRLLSTIIEEYFVPSDLTRRGKRIYITPILYRSYIPMPFFSINHISAFTLLKIRKWSSFLWYYFS